MSSTWSYSRRVGAFRTPTQTLYCLYETTCESNCFPHNPHESCIAFGTIEDLMPYIMMGMSSCMGGMLRGAHGRSLTPLGYLRAWMTAFATPLKMRDREIILHCGEWRSSLPVDKGTPRAESRSVQLAVSALRKHGLHAEAERVLEGKDVALQMYQHGDVLANIYDNCAGGGKLAPWMVFEPQDLGMQDAELAPSIPNIPPAVLQGEPTIYALNVEDPYGSQRSHYLMVDERTGRMTNGSFNTIAEDWLDATCIPLERDFNIKGTGVAAFKALMKREKVAHPPLPKGTIVRVDIRSHIRNTWKEEAFAALVKALGDPALDADGVLNIPFETLVSRDQYWAASNIHINGHVEFVLPAGDTAQEPAPQSELFAHAA